ncbi:MAG: amidohydrolase family protein [Pseudohongiella sp.]|uniref:amidohydrolase family protein n=1 Tax=Pseudohongiella sp. TaxID=1979412 RepID=UPI0034A067CF
MRLLLTCLLLLMPALVVAQSQTLYKNATLILAERSEILTNGYLLVADGRFVAVGQGEPDIEMLPDTDIVDLNNRYVSAGFIDTHAHMSLGAVTFEIDGETVSLQAANSLDIGRWNGEKLLAYGVTTVRNPGGVTAANIAYRDAQRRGSIVGPQAFVAGGIINVTPFEGLTQAVDNDDEIIAAIDSQAAMGVDYIKLYTELSAAQIAVAVARADYYKLPVIAHLEQLSWQTGAELGIDHLVHAMPISPDLLTDTAREEFLNVQQPGNANWYQWYQYMDHDSAPMQALYRQLVAHETAVDPTLIVFYNTFFANQESVTQNSALELVHPDLLANWREFFNFNIGWQADDYQQAQQVWPRVLKLVKELHDRGVLLSVGTDLGNPWVIPGVSFHQEMALLVDAGLTPMQVLALATANGAKVLGKEQQTGRLTNGLQADFVVFASDPTQDISHAQDIVAVYQAGAQVSH